MQGRPISGVMIEEVGDLADVLDSGGRVRVPDGNFVHASRIVVPARGTENHEHNDGQPVQQSSQWRLGSIVGTRLSTGQNG
jgi:hypothetical protein